MTQKAAAVTPVTECDRVLGELRAMKETDMHERIIIPLLKASGATHTNYTHGPQERGKDIVYVYKEIHGCDCLEVCQVKNEKLTGRAGATTSAFTVLEQLKQSRNIEVINPKTNQKELPDSVVLYTTWPLPDGALSDGKHFLAEFKKSGCKIISPETLVEQLRERLPNVYEEIAYPGAGISAAMQRYVSSHREAAAFDLSRTRKLDEFFINLGITPSGSILDRLVSGTSTPVALKNIQIDRDTCEDLVKIWETLPAEIKYPELFDVVKMRFKNKQTKNGVFVTAIPETQLEPVNEGSHITSEHRIIRQIRFPQFWSNILDYFHNAYNRVQQCDDLEKRHNLTGNVIETIANCAYLLEYMNESFDTPLLVPASSPTRTESSSLAFVAVPPDTLLATHSHVCLTGEPGAGKTCIGRRLAQDALERGIKCIYFPCSQILNSGNSLQDAIYTFVQSQTTMEIDDANSLLKNIDLLILDGCDEAATFPDVLAKDIHRLSIPEDNVCVCKVSENVTPRIPGDLSSHIEYRATTHELELKGALTQADFERIICLNQETDFEKPIRVLFERTIESKPKLVITTRDTSQMKLPRGFLQIRLMPFNDEQLEQFFKRWFFNSNLNLTPVLTFLTKNPHVQTICRNPMIATIVAALYENGYDLPQSRVEVYQKRLDLLLERWDSIRRVPSRNHILAKDKKNFLGRLAFQLHRDHCRNFNIKYARRVWIDGFSRHYNNIRIEDVLWELLHCNNLIEREGKDHFSLGHLSFQEFFAALGIVNAQEIKILAANVLDPWWRQVAVFYVGITGDYTKIVKCINDKYPLDDWNDLIEEMEVEARCTPEVVRTAVQEICAEYANEFDETEEFLEPVDQMDDELDDS